MAGLNFYTTTIINSNLDPDSGKKLFEKKKNATSDDSENILCIKRDFWFHKDNEKGKVLSVRKAAGYKEEMCKATINFDDTSLKAAIVPGQAGARNYCRLDIYLVVEGAEPYIYSTPWVQKGMPLWVEFTVKNGDTAANIATNVANIIKKNHLFLYDKDLLKVTVSGNNLVLEGTAEYQRFRNIELSMFSVDEEYATKVAEVSSSGAIQINTRGKNGFGTYSQIIKDLRLPTAANYQWTHLRQVETPIIGDLYDQYIIEYEAPSTNEGLGAVGQRLTSVTTHVFWINHNTEGLVTEWEAALEAVGATSGSTIE